MEKLVWSQDRKGSSMKIGNPLHPDGDRRLHHGMRWHFVPRTAPLTVRATCWVKNLWNEWYAAMSDRQIDHFRRACAVLVTMLLVGLFFWVDNMADVMGNKTYTIYRSNRTGQVVKVLNPKGQEVKMPLDEVAKLRHREYILVP